MKKLLFQLDTDEIPNTFDTVVGYDGGADHVTVIGGITPNNVGKLVDGTIFTRPPKAKKYTAIFVTGGNMSDGEAVFKAINSHYFSNFRVSIMLDSNGSNTTAAAAAACVMKHVDIRGKRAVILAGTGPVGQRAGVMMANAGAEVILTSRNFDRAKAVCDNVKQSFGVELTPASAGDREMTDRVLQNTQIILATGAGGVQLIAEEQWRDLPDLEIILDANATPPLGTEGVDMMDKGVERHGKICYGALGFGPLKLETHRVCISHMFESNDKVYDAMEILEIARELA